MNLFAKQKQTQIYRKNVWAPSGERKDGMNSETETDIPVYTGMDETEN